MFPQASFLLALATSATAHMILEYPVPFGKSSITQSPLAPGDFPCKQRTGVYDITEMNQWNAGETKTISFLGSAVHGGGSCQFSLTTDPTPSESSQWKVIQSVIGGCPSNATANLEPADAAGHGAATFPVKMPEGIPDGQYTFAWTWLNKRGNREFYMNCAPVQVGSGTGAAYSGGASDVLSKLPNMFVANLPDTSCSTKEGQDFNYPDPGANVIHGSGAELGNDISGAGCAAMTLLGAGNGQMGTPTKPNTPAKSSGASGQPAPAKPTSAYGQPAPATPTSAYGQPAPEESSPAEEQPAPEESSPAEEQPAPEESSPPDEQPTAAESSPAYGGSAPAAPAYPAAPVKSAAPANPGGVFAPGASKAPVARPTAPAASKPTPAKPSYGDAPSGSGNSDCTPCTNDGALVCIGTKQYGICDRGCAFAQDLATGTTCSNGSIAGSAKRSFRFPREHLHRRHGSARHV